MKVRIEMEVPNVTVAMVVLKHAARKIRFSGANNFDLHSPGVANVIGHVEFDVEPEETKS